MINDFKWNMIKVSIKNSMNFKDSKTIFKMKLVYNFIKASVYEIR